MGSGAEPLAENGYGAFAAGVFLKEFSLNDITLPFIPLFFSFPFLPLLSSLLIPFPPLLSFSCSEAPR